ncbi:MAG: FadR family transcriptional regulator, partial [Alphaproteobacteria bacterium]
MQKKEIFRIIGNKDRLVDRVVNEIQQLIIDQKLEPGVHLPPERDFAEQIGVSRTVLREAIQVLEVKGLLEVKHGIGTIVREVGRAQLSEPLNMLFLTRGITLDDLHQVRTILEVEIAHVAAQKATDQDVIELKSILKNLEDNMNSSEGFAKWDNEFHHTLAKLSRNPLLLMLLDSIGGLTQEVRLSVSNYPDLFNKVMPDHYEILSFIEARDASNARKSMRKHLENAREIQQLYVQDKNLEK